MSYRQAMKHARNPRKWKHTQQVAMSTGSGFWPSAAFLEEDYFPYMERCKAKGGKPISAAAYYEATLAGKDPETSVGKLAADVSKMLKE